MTSKLPPSPSCCFAVTPYMTKMRLLARKVKPGMFSCAAPEARDHVAGDARREVIEDDAQAPSSLGGGASTYRAARGHESAEAQVEVGVQDGRAARRTAQLVSRGTEGREGAAPSLRSFQ